MIAVDTNVVVRFLVRDDAGQAARAAELIRSGEIWISKTVLLETEWVLRSLYDFTPQSLAGALRALAGLGTVFLEDAGAVAKALDWFEQGLDFADALHLASAGNAKQFATFDRKFARQAWGVTKVETLVL
jgi:predicted nucleic-acid-binding protein